MAHFLRNQGFPNGNVFDLYHIVENLNLPDVSPMADTI